MNTRTHHHLLVPAVALLLAGSGLAQWTFNPVVERVSYAYEYGEHVEGCRLELANCPHRVTGGIDLTFARLDDDGMELPPRYSNDPTYGGPWGNPKPIYTTGPTAMVGCKVGPRDAMFAYTVTNTVFGAPLDGLRVTRYHWNATTDQYDLVAGFPVTIATHRASRLAITPNHVGGSIDGVHVVWCEENGGAVPAAIRQERVLGTNQLLWGGNGAVLSTSLGTTAPQQTPSVVSTGDGFAIATWHSSANGPLEHWTAKRLAGATFDIPAQVVPGQSNESNGKCCVASDGSGGAFYGFATDTAATNRRLRTARISSGNVVIGAVENAAPQSILRALSMLAMPNGHALLVYRDNLGIRCFDFTPTLGLAWTRFVRGASSPDVGDEADTVLLGNTAGIVTTSNEQVHVKAIDVNGVELWQNGGTHVNDATPPKYVTGWEPSWPHIWAIGANFQYGFMVGWGDHEDIDGCHLAERLTQNGVAGKVLTSLLPAAALLNDSAVLFDFDLLGPVTLSEFHFEQVGTTTGTVDVFGILGGTFLGNETNAAAWTLLGSGTVTQIAAGAPCRVVLATPIALPTGSHALCVKAHGFGLGSTAASGPALTMVSDDVAVRCGSHVANWPSGAVQANRVFQGGFTYLAGNTAPTASHLPFGRGCYTQSDSFYQRFTTATAAASTLAGSSLTMLPTGGGQFVAAWGGTTYVPPSPAALQLGGFLPNGDDGVTTVALTSPTVIAGNVVSQLYVHSNGNVWLGDNLMTLGALDFVPNATAFLNAPHAGFWSWHDWNVTEPGSGQIWFEEVGGIACVTWLDVESYPSGVVNRGTMQFQVDLMTGAVAMVWPNVSPISGAPGIEFLVGWSPGGVSPDDGSLVLPTALPLTTQAALWPLTLAASPAPQLGTTTTFTATNVPEAGPASGLYLGLQIHSLAATPGGLDLGFLGAPGCSLYVADLGLTQAMLGLSPTLSSTFSIPNHAALLGVELYTQSAAMFVPGSLGNGRNALGITTSNGIKSRLGN